MLIYECLVFLFILCSLLSAQNCVDPESIDSVKNATNCSSTNKLRSKSGKQLCWNGLGLCENRCPITNSRKIDHLCGGSKACCVPQRVVVPIKTVEDSGKFESQVSCGLNHGTCQIKCLWPTTVYRGSYNECPQRHFCCIKNL